VKEEFDLPEFQEKFSKKPKDAVLFKSIAVIFSFLKLLLF
jgi:hypothetical protein